MGLGKVFGIGLWLGIDRLGLGFGLGSGLGVGSTPTITVPTRFLFSPYTVEIP